MPLYRGWSVVIACGIIASFSWGLGFYGLGVYLHALNRGHGWSTGLISMAVTVYYHAERRLPRRGGRPRLFGGDDVSRSAWLKLDRLAALHTRMLCGTNSSPYTGSRQQERLRGQLVKPQPSVAVVILNWNGLLDTLECLGSLTRLHYPNWYAVVVDNGSARAEADTIEAAFPATTVLRNRDNVGYAAGNNVGVRHVLNQRADYIWLLNNDATVAPDCLTELIDAAEGHPRVALLSPVIYDYASPHGIQFSGTVLDGRREEQITLRSLTDTRAASQAGPILLWGTGLLLRRQLVDTIGLLDERYFAYHEDVDYCLRAIAAGFQTLVVPGAALYHKYSRSLGSGESPLKEYLLVRNWYLLWSTHLSGWRRRTYPQRYLAWVLTRVVVARQAGKDAVAEEALNGAWAALHGRWGSWEGRSQMPKALRVFLLNYLLTWHPYFWVLLLAGNLKRVTSLAIRKLSRLSGP